MGIRHTPVRSPNSKSPANSDGAAAAEHHLIIIEQDHRFIKKRIVASLGFRSAEGACRTIEGYEAMHTIRKGQIRWVGKGDPVGQCQFVHTIFGVAA